METETAVAHALINIGAVGFSLEKIITFKSGMRAPIYVDNRKVPFNPKEWKVVIDGFSQKIKDTNLDFDIIAGVEAAGIPHSAALAFSLQKPSVFVRKQVKDHGTKKLVEGGSVDGKKVVLVEDLVTTGESSLAAIKALRSEGALITHCLCIVSYDFEETRAAFKRDGVIPLPLTRFEVILNEAVRMEKLTQEQGNIISEWFGDPWGWADKHGY